MSVTFGSTRFGFAGSAFSGTMTGAGGGVPAFSPALTRRPDCAQAVAPKIDAPTRHANAIRRVNARERVAPQHALIHNNAINLLPSDFRLRTLNFKLSYIGSPASLPSARPPRAESNAPSGEGVEVSDVPL
jgi:hypothetical protein